LPERVRQPCDFLMIRRGQRRGFGRRVELHGSGRCSGCRSSIPTRSVVLCHLSLHSLFANSRPPRCPGAGLQTGCRT
jgi:hypothetical protein